MGRSAFVDPGASWQADFSRPSVSARVSRNIAPIRTDLRHAA